MIRVDADKQLFLLYGPTTRLARVMTVRADQRVGIACIVTHKLVPTWVSPAFFAMLPHINRVQK